MWVCFFCFVLFFSPKHCQSWFPPRLLRRDSIKESRKLCISNPVPKISEETDEGRGWGAHAAALKGHYSSETNNRDLQMPYLFFLFMKNHFYEARSEPDWYKNKNEPIIDLDVGKIKRYSLGVVERRRRSSRCWRWVKLWQMHRGKKGNNFTTKETPHLSRVNLWRLSLSVWFLPPH